MKDLNKYAIMSHSKSYLLIFFLIICSFQSKAHPTYGTITNFQILPEYLNANGDIKINSTTATTQVKYKVTVVRTVYSTYPTLVWNDTNISFGLSTGNTTGTPVYVAATTQVTNQAFPSGSAVLQDFIVTANINKSFLVSGRDIILGYKTPEDWTIRSYNSISYGFEIFTPQPEPGTPPSFNAPVPGSVPLYSYISNTKRFLTTTYYSSYPDHTYGGTLGYVFSTATPGTVPLYEYLLDNGDRYYTVNQGNYNGYTFVKIVCYVYANQIPKTLPVYQHYTLNSGGYHHYSNTAGSYTGYIFEDIQFYILQNPQVTTYPLPEEDCAELYQYFSIDYRDHYYTTVKRTYLPDYHFEQVLGYIHTIQKPGTIPLYIYFMEAYKDPLLYDCKADLF